MTPKEKADHLIKRFTDIIPYMDEYSAESIVKDCARIVVEEIIDEIKHSRRTEWIKEREGGQEYVDYWEDVLTELNRKL